MDGEPESPSAELPLSLRRGRVLMSPEIREPDVFEAVRRHLAVMAGGPGGRVIKRAPKTNVTLLDPLREAGGPRVCVKEFVRHGLRRLLPGPIRHRPAYRSWRAARLLAERGIGAPATWAALIGRKERSYVIMREIDNAQHLFAYAKQAVGRSMPLDRRRAFARAGAGFLARCYAAGVYHEDLKSTNLFVRETAESSWDFILLDLAAVKVPARPSRAARLLNMAQINASTPAEVTRTDRLRFLRNIAETDRSLGGRGAVEEIMRLTRRRGGVWPA